MGPTWGPSGVDREAVPDEIVEAGVIECVHPIGEVEP